MSLLDKNILNYYLKYPNFRIWIFDEKGNKLGRFTNFGYSNKLLDSDKSVIFWMQKGQAGKKYLCKILAKSMIPLKI